RGTREVAERLDALGQALGRVRQGQRYPLRATGRAVGGPVGGPVGERLGVPVRLELSPAAERRTRRAVAAARPVHPRSWTFTPAGATVGVHDRRNGAARPRRGRAVLEAYGAGW